MELSLSYYNSNTSWVGIDALLSFFGLNRSTMNEPQTVAEAIREQAKLLPTYVTIKEVKRRWGHGQEDIFPTSVKFMGHMTSLANCTCNFILVTRKRGNNSKMSPNCPTGTWMGVGIILEIMRVLSGSAGTCA